MKQRKRGVTRTYTRAYCDWKTQTLKYPIGKQNANTALEDVAAMRKKLRRGNAYLREHANLVDDEISNVAEAVLQPLQRCALEVPAGS